MPVSATSANQESMFRSAAVAAGRSDRTTGAGDDVLVQCLGLTKTFRDFWLRHRVRAVDGVDLKIQRGEVYGLLGPNGSGKSTTIKMILGLLHPTAGRIAVFGKRPEDVAIKKHIGYLPEESYLYRFLNAWETLDYYGRLFHQDRRQRQRRIGMLLDMVGLEAVQRRPVGEYSKGMQRRIGLAQALINDPQLLILDEPTTGLDPIGTRQIKDLIVELAGRGKTVLLCSHLLADVEDVCDRIAVMFGGKVRVEGPVDELLVQQDMTTIETPQLDDQTIQELKRVLSSHGCDTPKIDRPRQRLETLFLEIVHRAQQEGVATSGATGGGPLAAFLTEQEQRGSHLPESLEPAKVIAQLVQSDEAIGPEASPAEGEPASASAESLQRQAVIDRMTQPSPGARLVEADEPAERQQPDRSVIDGLTGRQEPENDEKK